MTGPDDTLVAGPLQTGDVVADRYEIIGLIGMGGMGAVYRARQLAVDRDVALKVIRSAAGGSTGGGVMMRKRFEREAAVVGKLCHPNTVRLFDFGVHGDDMLFMALELIDGRSLVEVLTEGPLHPDRAAFVVGQTLEALVEAHAAGLVHRDLKPGNIMVSHASWDAQTVKVLDFGIAKVRYEAGITDEQLTATGMMLGTVRYMAPEQLDGGEVDARADIYAMGCVLYHLLTGVPPFSGSTLMELVQKKVLEDVPALSGGLAWHPLGRVVRTATARQPADRYADAKTMAEAVRAAVTAAPSPPRSTHLVVACGVFAAIAIAAVIWASRDRPAPASPPPAVATATEAPSAAGTPKVVDPAVRYARRHLERGREALKACEFASAQRFFESAAGEAPFLLAPRLYLAWTHIERRRSATAIRLLEAASATRAMAEEELEAEMIRLLLRGLRQGSRDKALAKDAVAFIEANERSYQAVLWGGLVQGEAGDGKGHLVTLDYAIRLDATGGLAYLHKARLQHWRGDFVEADLTIDQGLLHNPRSPALLIAQGDIALARGALSQADWAARQALEVDGGAVDARRLLASVLLAQGDERGRAGEEALAMAGGVSLPSRLRFGRDHAEALINRGRVAAGVALGRKTVAMAVAGGDYGQAVRVLAGLSSTANLLGRWGELKELTARIGEMAGQPEVADTDRDFMIASRVRFDGLAAVGLGDLEGGKRALARLEAIPAERVPYHSTDTYGRGLKVAIAVAEGRYPEAITEARKLPSPCRGPYKLGQVLLKSGEEEGARAAFERVAARRTRCFRRSHYAGPAYAGALAQLVKLAIEDNGPDAVKRARDNLLGFQAFWPSPDPDLPMARLIQNSRGHVPIK